MSIELLGFVCVCVCICVLERETEKNIFFFKRKTCRYMQVCVFADVRLCVDVLVVRECVHVCLTFLLGRVIKILQLLLSNWKRTSTKPSLDPSVQPSIVHRVFFKSKAEHHLALLKGTMQNSQTSPPQASIWRFEWDPQSQTTSVCAEKDTRRAETKERFADWRETLAVQYRYHSTQPLSPSQPSASLSTHTNKQAAALQHSGDRLHCSLPHLPLVCSDSLSSGGLLTALIYLLYLHTHSLSQIGRASCRERV